METSSEKNTGSSQKQHIYNSQERILWWYRKPSREFQTSLVEILAEQKKSPFNNSVYVLKQKQKRFAK